MAHLRFKSQFSPGPPPPSPMPPRSGTEEDHFPAPDSENIVVVDRLLKLPDYVQCLVMAGIDYHSLLSGDKYSISCLLRSASEFGTFRINNHGLSAEDLESALADSHCVFGSSSVFRRRVDDRREEFMWCRSNQITATSRYRSLSEKMEIVASKLETIAEELGNIISINTSKQNLSKNKIEASEATLSLYRHNLPSLRVNDPSAYQEDDCRSSQCCRHALSLHVPIVDKAEFCFRSEQTPSSSFYTAPDTIVITIGEQLEEWSKGEFKSAYGEVHFKPDENQASNFSFEFKCTPSIFNQEKARVCEWILDRGNSRSAAIHSHADLTCTCELAKMVQKMATTNDLKALCICT